MKRISLFTVMLVSASLAWAQTRQIKGRIVDKATGQGVPDVSVMIKGTNTGARTDANGDFVLPVNSSGKVTLEASAVGFGTQTISASGNSPLVVTLLKQDKSMDEVVVVGYGTVRKKDLTGSVVSVKPEDLKKVPSANLMESVQGKLPGVDITRSSGAAGAGVNITVRGNRSITANNNPLVIVDGIQYNSIQDINPNDVATMDVLKDAASTAIYGSRGANGVIIITTKKGTAGKPRISFNANYGVSQISAYPKFMDAEGFMTAERWANKKTTDYPGGVWQSPADDSKLSNISPAELANYQKGISTDYPSMLLRNGSQKEYQAGVSAGSEKTKVYLSLDYFNEQGLLKNNYLNRYTGRLNVDQTLSSVVKVGLQSQITYYNQYNRTDNSLSIANRISPLTVPFDSLGNYIILPRQKDVNPLLDNDLANYSNNTVATRTLGAAYIEITPFKGLSFRSNAGVLLHNQRNGIFRGKNSVERYLSGTSEAFNQDSSGYEITWENIATYNKQVGAHQFNLTGVTSFLEKKSDNVAAQGHNQLLASSQFYALGTNAQDYVISSGYYKENLVSFTGRFNYTYKGKYLATLIGRSDGSSKLSPGNKWAFFPSASFAWRAIDESFMRAQHLFSDLKVRVSYGTSGNDAVKAYSTQASLVRIPFSFGNTSNYGYAFGSNLSNPNLKWEITNTANLGFDLALLNNRVSATIDLYDARTHNLLLNRSLPPTGGIASIVQNGGKTRNTGIDLSVNGQIIRSKDLSWNSTVTFSANRERIVELPGGANDIANGWFIGQPVKVFYDYRKVGIWQLDERAEAAKYGQKPGDIKVQDVNGKGSISSVTDRMVLGHATPTWTGGFNSLLKYKSFDLDFFVYARIGQMINYEYNTRFDPSVLDNIGRFDYWTDDNPTNNFPRPRSGTAFAGLQYGSTLGYVNGSFVKLRNLTLGYSIGQNHLNTKVISNVRFYVTGKNLLTFSQFKNTYDPERGGPIGDPMTRLIMGGVNLDF